jgi:hypothetical protein
LVFLVCTFAAACGGGSGGSDPGAPAGGGSGGGGGGDAVPFVDGASCLFAGHSFFVPVALNFDLLAQQNGFSAHGMDTVFAGGAAGSPRSLWEDAEKREAITAKLATGLVELFGLTWFGEGLSSFEDYARWFDLALTHNPDTTFFIGQPWMAGGPTVDAATYDQLGENVAQETFQTVLLLREAYPDNPIVFIDYGKTAAVMKLLFEEGSLPDIEGLVPDPQNGIELDEALFADGVIGHAGPMLQELCALLWLGGLYGADLDAMAYSDYESDVPSILTDLENYNAQFEQP